MKSMKYKNEYKDYINLAEAVKSDFNTFLRICYQFL